jgi:Protein of unknown function (DUF4242)
LPKFLDVHHIKRINEDILKQIQMSPKDEFGVTHVNILFNPEADRVFCILDAPDKGAVEKNHQKLGIKCEWIMEVKETASGA